MQHANSQTMQCHWLRSQIIRWHWWWGVGCGVCDWVVWVGVVWWSNIPQNSTKQPLWITSKKMGQELPRSLNEEVVSKIMLFAPFNENIPMILNQQSASLIIHQVLQQVPTFWYAAYETSVSSIVWQTICHFKLIKMCHFHCNKFVHYHHSKNDQSCIMRQ